MHVHIVVIALISTLNAINCAAKIEEKVNNETVHVFANDPFHLQCYVHNDFANQEQLSTEWFYLTESKWLPIVNATECWKEWPFGPVPRLCNLTRTSVENITYKCIYREYEGEVYTKYFKVVVYERELSVEPIYHINYVVVGTCSIICIIILCGARLVCKKYGRTRTYTAKRSFKIMKRVTVERQSKNLAAPLIKFTENTKKFGIYTILSPKTEYILPVDRKWEVGRKDIKLGNEIGSGFFGVVYEAVVKRSLIHEYTTNYTYVNTESTKYMKVAVKMLKDSTDFSMTNLITEMEIMKDISSPYSHPNVIQFFKCCVGSDGPLWLIMEFAENGNLKDFLRKSPKMQLYTNFIGSQELTEFSIQIARGMDFLSSRGLVHRDLAARNVLVSENNTAKISDFGLTKRMEGRQYLLQPASSANHILPMKWIAPEILAPEIFGDRITTKSDVWSFGVLLYELFSYGSDPFPNVSMIQFTKIVSGKDPEEVIKCIDCQEDSSKKLLNSCPVEIMKRCFDSCPSKRPSFAELAESLTSHKVILNTNVEQNQLVQL